MGGRPENQGTARRMAAWDDSASANQELQHALLNARWPGSPGLRFQALVCGRTRADPGLASALSDPHRPIGRPASTLHTLPHPACCVLMQVVTHVQGEGGRLFMIQLAWPTWAIVYSAMHRIHRSPSASCSSLPGMGLWTVMVGLMSLYDSVAMSTAADSPAPAPTPQ